MTLLLRILAPVLIAFGGTLGCAAQARADAAPSPPPSATAPNCVDGRCSVTLSAAEILRRDEEAVARRDYHAARILTDLLARVPAYRYQYHFLSGFIAEQTGDLHRAERDFRADLAVNPRDTRIRLELARTLQRMGKADAADYHYRLAQESAHLPADVTRFVATQRGILRDDRTWHAGFDIGLVPDSNFNSATSSDTVLVNFGPVQLPLTLNAQARRQSGIGEEGSFTGGIRHRVNDKVALIADLDASAVNYPGTYADDIAATFDAGVERTVSDHTRLSLVALTARRWYGGNAISVDFGARLGFETIVGRGQRLGGAVEVRHTASPFSADYAGWSYGGNVSYEHVVLRSMVASASLFVRRDSLNSPIFANQSYGVSLGMGGELPHGINAGVSGAVSRADFDAANPLFGTAARRDTRLTARVYLGLRSVRVLGFSPSIEYNFNKVDSNDALYSNTRSRAEFKLARYF